MTQTFKDKQRGAGSRPPGDSAPDVGELEGGSGDASEPGDGEDACAEVVRVASYLAEETFQPVCLFLAWWGKDEAGLVVNQA